jgi:hypothetical protein
MKSPFSLPVGLSAFWLLAWSSTSHAHTWIEQLTVIASNGTFIGTPGYPRGLVDRLPNVNPNAGNVYELPPDGRPTGNEILPTDPMCKSTQPIGNQTAGNPALIASPGDMIALRYQENGHVTQPQLPAGKPEGSGTVFVYGTEKPSNSDTYLGIHRVWNAAGTGGDGRGVLLATRYFDDGQCYQNNTSAISQARQKEFTHTPDALMNTDIWCQTDVQIPTDASGNYTLYWVWEWPTLDSAGNVETNESYTSCMDIVLNPSSGSVSAESVNFISPQNLNYAAIAKQMSTQFLVNPEIAEQTYISAGPTSYFTGNALTATATSAAPVQITIAVSQSASAQSSAGGEVVTVTVTAAQGAPTTTITETITVTGGSPTPVGASTIISQAQTATVSPLALSNTAAQASATLPPVIPFISPSQGTNVPAQESTLKKRAIAATSNSEIFNSAPSTSANLHSGDPHKREFKVRGRGPIRRTQMQR